MKYVIGVASSARPIVYLMAETSSDEELGTVEHWHEDVSRARLFDTKVEAIEKAKITPPGWNSGAMFVQAVAV